MKFKIKKDILLKKIQMSTKFCLNKISTNSSLQGTLLVYKKNLLEIISTNLTEYFYTSINIENEEEGRCVVDSKKIIEFLSLLSGDLEIEIKDNKFFIKNNKTQGIFNLISADDYPKKPEIEGEKMVLKNKFIKENFPLVLFSTAKDDSRPVLTSINFSNKNNFQYLVSTDGFRLSLFKTKEKILDANISSSVLNEILGFLESEDILISYSKENKTVLFEISDIKIYSQLIEGDFPPFEKVIPEDCKSRIVINREELLKNIKLNSIFARDYSNIVIFNIKKDGLYIKPKIKEEGVMSTFQEAEINGEENTIAFNYRFILDFLNNIKEKEIVFEMNSKNAPGIFRIKNKEDFLYIVMPVRIDDEEN